MENFSLVVGLQVAALVARAESSPCVLRTIGGVAWDIGNLSFHELAEERVGIHGDLTAMVLADIELNGEG